MRDIVAQQTYSSIFWSSLFRKRLYSCSIFLVLNHSVLVRSTARIDNSVDIRTKVGFKLRLCNVREFSVFIELSDTEMNLTLPHCEPVTVNERLVIPVTINEG